MQEEKIIQNKILIACNSQTARLWPNYRGKGWTGQFTRHGDGVLIKNARYIDFGLAGNGASDIIGFRQVTITPEMVGQEIAQFVALEVKTATGRIKPTQENFLEVIKDFGGVSGIVRSVEDTVKILKYDTIQKGEKK
jgi:hypothetical protein